MPTSNNGPVNDIDVICINIATPVIEIRYQITLSFRNASNAMNVLFYELLSEHLICR
jgi:hypothetical protein